MASNDGVDEQPPSGGAAGASASTTVTGDDIPECCRTGFLANGTPSGSEAKVGGVMTYIARPELPSQKAIVIFTDIFGWTFVNTRLVADAMAKETGFNVYVPDLMDGHAITIDEIGFLFEKPTSAWQKWVSKPIRVIGALPSAIAKLWHNGDANVLPLVDSFIKAVRDPDSLEKITHVAGIGYCWGGRYAALASGNNQIDAVVLAHPSRVEIPSHFEKFQKPTLFLLAERDFLFPYPKAIEQIKPILDKNNVPHETHMFPGTDHGFAIRGDENDEVYIAAKKKALAIAIKFFKSHL